MMDGMSTPTSSDTDEGFERSLTQICALPTKVFHDVVHPHMELPYLCYEIINTPQFQRLRNLKQLGTCNFVYPSASHCRFQHCIGTCYLAGKYARVLQRNQPELQIEANDILCLEVAGLCHDLGHGPFSHLWESFQERFSKDNEKKYSHEEMSIVMFDFMIEDNKLQDSFRVAGLSKRDIIFIKEAIYGKPLNGDSSFVGRDRHKYFMYQIVSNEETKVDVDKFDYLLRDSKQLNIPTAFDYDRVLDNTRVIQVEENGNSLWKLAYRQKIAENLDDLFRGRYRLHQNAYQHKVIKISDEMIIDGLVAAEPHFMVFTNDRIRTLYTLSTAHKDPSAFMKLTDSVFELILNYGAGGIEAETIFGRILRRDLYKQLGFFKECPEGEEWNRLLHRYPKLALIRLDFNYGKGNEHPLNSAIFYEKNRPDDGFHVQYDVPPMKCKYYIIYKSECGSEVANPLAVNLGLLNADLQEFANAKGIKIYFE